MKDESDVYTNYNRCPWYSHQSIIKGIGGLGNKRTSGDLKRDLRRIAVTQTPVKDHQLTLM